MLQQLNQINTKLKKPKKFVICILYTTCLIVLIRERFPWVGNHPNCGLCFNSSMFVFVFSFNIFFLSYQILFLKKMAKFVLIICCTLLPVCDLYSLIYKTLLTKLCLLRKIVNLGIDIKFVSNYNIFLNLPLTLLGVYSSSPIFIGGRKWQFKVAFNFRII